MSMTDPIADLLTRLRNGVRARKTQVEAPWSRIKERVVGVMVEEGFLSEYSVVEQGSHKVLRVWLRYDPKHRPVITGIKRISRPSLRSYVAARAIPSVRGGLGINILSTSAGVLVDREAAKRGLGGEVLCSVW
ncbi:MAG TPA: 30S ribosomal protein S8 [Candidatus Kryptonia bacterium]|nr:30S ribosomal protein S8 [Candidatus Kryptonia bacterium]